MENLVQFCTRFDIQTVFTILQFELVVFVYIYINAVHHQKRKLEGEPNPKKWGKALGAMKTNTNVRYA